MPVDPSFAMVWDVLACAMPAINAASNSAFALFPVQIVSGTQQVGIVVVVVWHGAVQRGCVARECCRKRPGAVRV